ncbi:hypothetical protein ACFQ1T_13525 [Methylophilus glucosoxydans]|uniref:Uncharacterized protein n=1 Tax=Methylophilus glucosoxydans TaxID=752553 RepID=A0ABW3GMA0_9PROT
MKLTTIKFIKLNLLVLCISVITNANAKPEDECEKQLLSTQGLSVSGNTISPGQIFPISLVSDKGKVEATIELSLKKMKNAVVVDGEIKNVGNCVISTFMPVGLHPIKNGLPLKWHTLPEGLKHSSPTLKPGEFVKFFKKYSIEYAWGFNIKVGTFWLSPSDKPAENNLDACSDKAIAKQLEKIADQETKSELDVCQSAEAMKRVNQTTLELIDKCSTKSKELQILKNNIEQNSVKLNSKINQECFAETKYPTSKKSMNKKTSISQGCDDVYKRVQHIYDQEINNNSNITNMCENAKATVRGSEMAIKLYEECNYENDVKEVNKIIKDGYQDIENYCK